LEGIGAEELRTSDFSSVSWMVEYSQACIVEVIVSMLSLEALLK
jgi:hypothetical protein